MNRELMIFEMQALLHTSQPTIYRHLSVLMHLILVERETMRLDLLHRMRV